MENQRNREQGPDQQQEQTAAGRHTGTPQGFEGMNFEEQRSGYKNSDGAGAGWNQGESQEHQNGRSGPAI